MKCICDFETQTLKDLRRHFALCHRNLDFLDLFQTEIESNWHEVSRTLRRAFLLKKQDYKCSRCNFNERRECGSVILEIDHIDGNHQNNALSNLRVLCPNCHALTPKYRNWKNVGNKKITDLLRPGNKNYDKRKELNSPKRQKTLFDRQNVESKKKEKKIRTDEAMIKLKEIKAQFEEDFKKEVLRLHETGEVDFSKYGWVQILADKLDEQPQILGRRVRKLLPDFFVEHCFSRQYNHYKKKVLEGNRPDEETVLKTVAD